MTTKKRGRPPGKKTSDGRTTNRKKNTAKRADDKRLKQTGAKHTSSEQVQTTITEMMLGDEHPLASAGGPSIYTRQVGAEICLRLSLGESLNTISKNYHHLPSKAAILHWALFGDDEHHFRDPELRKLLSEFKIHYQFARMAQAESLIDECTDIADDSTNDYMEKVTKFATESQIVIDKENINRSKLRIETRKWLAEIYLPKVQALRNQNLKINDGSPVILKFDSQDADA